MDVRGEENGEVRKTKTVSHVSRVQYLIVHMEPEPLNRDPEARNPSGKRRLRLFGLEEILSGCQGPVDDDAW